MNGISEKEMEFVLTLFKSPEKDYSASSIAKVLDITSMGALKIARKLEKEDILNSKSIGRSKIYKLNIKNDYVKPYLFVLLKREAEKAPAYIKVWINEVKKIKSAESSILFGSILRKENVGDIDVLFIVKQNKFEAVKKEIEAVDKINLKKIHPIFQAEKDILSNIKKEDKVIQNAIKGLFLFGENKLIDLLLKNE
jgi:predicted nucleotidyltransferase